MMMESRTILLPLVLCLFGSVLSQLNCPPLPPHTAENITDLRPNDIKVIMTLGDSISAAFGVDGLKGTWNEFRGVSFDTGGDPGAITIGNFLKTFSPNITGQSLGVHVVELCYGDFCPGKYHPDQDVFDAAQSGAMITDLLTHEWDYLLTQVTTNPNVDMVNDWKLLTIFIGGNDLCASCGFLKKYLTPDEFEDHMTALLTEVHAKIPRVFVQIVEMFNISQVYNLSLTSKYCTDIHQAFFFECDCIFKRENEAARLEIDSYAQAYNQRSQVVAAKFASLKDPQFTVVTQPFARNAMLADMPIDLISTLDCFHPSVRGHQGMAVALWNNMITPMAQKRTTFNLSDVPLCPTADTIIYAY